MMSFLIYVLWTCGQNGNDSNLEFKGVVVSAKLGNSGKGQKYVSCSFEGYKFKMS